MFEADTNIDIGEFKTFYEDISPAILMYCMDNLNLWQDEMRETFDWAAYFILSVLDKLCNGNTVSKRRRTYLSHFFSAVSLLLIRWHTACADTNVLADNIGRADV